MYGFICRREDITQYAGLSAVVNPYSVCRFICSGEDITQCAVLFAVVRTLLSVWVYLQ